MGDLVRNFVIGRDYIANQFIETQNVYMHAPEVQHTTNKNEHSARNAEETDYVEMKPYCEYINLDALKGSAYTPAEFEEMMARASEEDAPTFARFLKKYKQLTYINFHGHSNKRIYTTLQEHFPMMRKYSYKNFTNYL